MKTKKRTKLWIALLAIFLVAAAIGTGIAIWYFSSGYTSQQLKGLVETPTDSTNAATDATDTSSVIYKENPIDFDKLQEINADLYAWIKIPNTSIDYPVAQAYYEADSFYLDHNIYKEYEFAGTIYTEKKNSKDFSDPNTVLYGHNMLNGTMFQNLHYFQDPVFFNENDTLYIYTPGHILTYRIFAAYQYDDRHILNSFDFSDEAVFAQYLEDCLNPRSMLCNVREDTTLTTDDKIITLSTCLGSNKSVRYLVQGVLIKDERTR